MAHQSATCSTRWATDTASNQVLLASYSYTLHPTGRRTGAVEILRNAEEENPEYVTNTFTWQYDGLYRLTNEVNSSSWTDVEFETDYEYDLVGNRLKRVNEAAATTTTTYGYNDNDQLTHQTNSAVVTAFTYDANGSLTSQSDINGTVSYTYNLANRLSKVTAGTTTRSYLYNDSGIRVRKTVNGTAKHYLVDANNHTGYAQVLEEFASLGAPPTVSYAIGDDVLGQCGQTTSDPRWLLYDGHGSTRQVVSKAVLDVKQLYNYDAYGKTLTALPSSPETSLLYCGEQFESHGGGLEQYYLRARYLNPDTGRFNGLDPWAGDTFDPQSLHKYSYAHCDAVNGADPSGNSLTLKEVLVAVGIALNIASFVYHQSQASKAYARADDIEGAKNQAWAMVDLAFLLAPGSGMIGPSLQIAGRTVEISAAMLRAGVQASAVWGYITSLFSVAETLGEGGSPLPSDEGQSGEPPTEGPGRWGPETQSWSADAQAYQWQITGQSGRQYWVGNTRFDGWLAGKLLDAKARYSHLVKNGQWQRWFNSQVWVRKAQLQRRAAGNTPIEWHFAEKEVADLVRPLVRRFNIKVVHTPRNYVLE